jgi:hypothetical protein
MKLIEMMPQGTLARLWKPCFAGWLRRQNMIPREPTGSGIPKVFAPLCLGVLVFLRSLANQSAMW